MTIAHQFLSPSEAQRLTQRIKFTAGTIRDNLWKLRNLVEEAKQSNVWQVLGYQSWTAYLADTLADEPMRLGRDERQELVGYLSGEGLSTRAIAPIVGTSHMQVKRDIDAGVTNVTPAEPDLAARRTRLAEQMSEAAERALAKVELAELGSGIVSPDTVPKPIDAREPAADISAEIKPAAEDVPLAPAQTVEPRAITGLDGKTYATPAPTAPRRKALTDSAKDIGYDLRKVAERLERMREDDRFSRNKEEVAALLKGHLMFTVEVCQDLLDEFTN